MIQTIRVAAKDTNKDLKGIGIYQEIIRTFPTHKINQVQTVKVYRVEGVTTDEAKRLAETLFCEDITQQYSINKSLFKNSPNKVEIAYKPGVMNPEVSTILKSAHDLKIVPLAVDSSYEYGFYGNVSKNEAQEIVEKLKLYNSIVEYVVSTPPQTLLIKGQVGKTKTIAIRKLSNEQLMELSQDKLFLNLEEMKLIQDYFKKIKRDPTDCELETLAQTWSEHCAHKTFKAKLIIDGKEKKPLMSRIKTEALKHDKNIVSAFIDNSGVMDFFDGYSICGKAETHNSPSAIEPYGGAMTGSGGVFRDIVGTGKGAKTVVSTDIFCLAPPDMSLKKLPSGCLPPQYMLKRVVEAVRDYGNRIGIPTNNGSFHFHDDFRAKPTVLVGGYGIMPTKYAKKGTAKVGDMIVAVGGRTGRDGIHGATFSSGEMTERTINVNSSAVQIGNAIEEKRVFDALLEARDLNLIRALQDCGAGGFSSAVGEMAEKTGAKIDLSRAALKYPGLAPWEIWISESQERMVAAIPKEKIKTFLAICKKYNVEVSQLGTFDGSKQLRIYYGKELVADLSMKFVHDGLPQRVMKGIKPAENQKKNHEPSLPKTQKEWMKALSTVLSDGNICSKEPIVRLYDHSVQGTNDLQPYGGVNLDAPNDAVVIRPFIDKKYGMVVSHGLNPVLNLEDAYWGSLWAAAEALANYVAVGGDYKNATLINNYVWPFPDEESLWSLDKSVDAVVDVMKTFKIPVISGKDSLSSTYRDKSGFVLKIPPVLCISVFGKIKNAAKTTTADFKKEGSVICIVGKQDLSALGKSTYSQSQTGIPHVNLQTMPETFRGLHAAIKQGKVLSCHDVSEGGLITALFEMCLGGNMGTDIDVQKISKNVRPDYILFNETAGCFLVEVSNKMIAKKIFKKVPYKIIGITQKNKIISVQNGNEKLFDVDLDFLKNAWKKPMQQYFK